MIIGNFIIFFFAGMDTTAHLATMVLYQLLAHEDCFEKVKKEIQENYLSKENPSIEDLKKMEYFDCFIKETLRQFSPVPSTELREAIEDHNIGDIKIRKGDMVTMNAFYNSFNSKHFDEPDKFYPERWANNKVQSDAYAFTPFWAGPRNCIGQHLALLETKVIVCEFVGRYDCTVDKDFKLSMSFGTGYEANPPIKINLNEKSKE